MTYELWEHSTGNLIGSFDHEGDALALAQRAIDRHGEDYLSSWTLASVAPSGHTKTLALGLALADRVLGRP